jgi:predicted alpha/beta-fold hydrolase
MQRGRPTRRREAFLLQVNAYRGRARAPVFSFSFRAPKPDPFPAPIPRGYSLGAIILTKYIAEAAAGRWPATVDAAACVSSPFCLHAASGALAATWAGLAYNAALAARLRHYFWTHQTALRAGVARAAKDAAADVERGLPAPPAADLDSLSTAWLIQHYDARAVAALFGYPDAAAYYDDASSLAHMPGVRVPTLYVAARDDPFLGELPTGLVAANPALALAVTDRGGHCAFLGRDLVGAGWAEGAVVEWAAEALAEVGLGRPQPPRPPAQPHSRL